LIVINKKLDNNFFMLTICRVFSFIAKIKLINLAPCLLWLHWVNGILY